ncbi:TrkA family potassium uptake protein [Streptomyces sp. 3MP-14]|uniref:TrkA family potassium uptake protein n=1 Tax=Streptomyces mimosae TaxID=2586635 RepID=A0A5N6A003_9ACTN|nr:MULTISPECIES: TrkA family potassium uptake protein [Streptomyces]KAB8161393.1 TrkA family potassium uptake protein [Streptomyces mimosae]KAB8173283.1 TrkA family potassium uptake protein [Streptomyces sp. 3MP-14]
MSSQLHAMRRRRGKRTAAAHAPAEHHRDQRIAVVGLGRFGTSLAEELMRRGWEVLGIDSDERLVQQHRDVLTHVVLADATDEEVLRQLGVHEFPRAVVAIGTQIEASILTTSNLLELGVRNLWAKAISRQHGKILERLGAHHVILPEHEMGERVAHLVTGRMLNFIEFDDDYALVKTIAPESTTGMPLSESGVRREHGVTVVGVKRPGQQFTHATAETVVHPGDVIVVTGRTAAVEAFAELT